MLRSLKFVIIIYLFVINSSTEIK